VNNSIRRLHQLTLSLEEALATEDWLSMRSLLCAREEILSSVSNVEADQAGLAQVIAADQRCQARLNDRMEVLLGKLRTTYQQKRATAAYVPARFSPNRLLEEQG
jgi:hypothetical protein